jgi:hypothetical protein
MSQIRLSGPKYGARKINSYSKPDILNVELFKNDEEIGLITGMNDIDLYYQGSDILYSNRLTNSAEPIPDYLNNYSFIIEVKDTNHIKKYDNNFFEAVFSTNKLKSSQFTYVNNILTIDLDTKNVSYADARWNYDYIVLNDNQILTHIKSNNGRYNDINHIKIKIYFSDLGAKKLERYFTKYPLA